MKTVITILALLLTSFSSFGQAALSILEARGTDYFKQGKLAEATAEFKKALAEKPNSLYSIRQYLFFD